MECELNSDQFPSRTPCGDESTPPETPPEPNFGTHQTRREQFSFVSLIPVYAMALCAAGGALVRFKIKHEGPETYSNMWQKVRAIWKYISFHYKDDFDWFVLGGDDLFVIVENLRKVRNSTPCGAKPQYFLISRAFATGY